MLLNKTFFGAIIVALLAACTMKIDINEDKPQYVEVADTITYLVYVRPQFPADEYKVKYLSHLEREKLLDMIFDSIYSHGAKAYDFVTGEEMSIDDVKSLEIENPCYSRDNVSAIQFTEAWGYNAEALSFQKKVLKIHIGYAVYDEDSIIVANRPSWVIDMKE